jgi:hypothetical protein
MCIPLVFLLSPCVDAKHDGHFGITKNAMGFLFISRLINITILFAYLKDLKIMLFFNEQ